MIITLLVCVCVAVVTGDSADDVYVKVKDLIQQHSNSSTVWVASTEKL